jgi:hypothetical protein
MSRHAAGGPGGRHQQEDTRMEGNPITCGNCGATNPPDTDFCESCGEPLTRSGEEGMLEQEEAQVEGGVYGIGEADAELERANPDRNRPPHRGT